MLDDVNQVKVQQVAIDRQRNLAIDQTFYKSNRRDMRKAEGPEITQIGSQQSVGEDEEASWSLDLTQSKHQPVDAWISEASRNLVRHHNATTFQEAWRLFAQHDGLLGGSTKASCCLGALMSPFSEC